MNHLEDLSLICNGTKWAAYKSLTAANSLVLIDHCSPLLIRSNGIHTAALGTGTFQMHDCIVRTCICTFAAFDAFTLIDMTSAIFKRDRTLGANLFTGPCETVLAILCYLVLIGGASMAGIRNNIDQRRLIKIGRASCRERV